MSRFDESRAIVIYDQDTPAVETGSWVNIPQAASGGMTAAGSGVTAWIQVLGTGSATAVVQGVPYPPDSGAIVPTAASPPALATFTTVGGGTIALDDVPKTGRYRVDVTAIAPTPTRITVWIVT